MSNTTHFISQGYTVIKTPQGQYSFVGTKNADMREHLSNVQEHMRLLHRQVAALTLFLVVGVGFSPTGVVGSSLKRF